MYLIICSRPFRNIDHKQETSRHSIIYDVSHLNVTNVIALHGHLVCNLIWHMKQGYFCCEWDPIQDTESVNQVQIQCQTMSGSSQVQMDPLSPNFMSKSKYVNEDLNQWSITNEASCYDRIAG